MDLINTYLMMQGLSSIGSATGNNNLSSQWMASTANALNFRSIMQNLQTGNTQNTTSTDKTGSLSAGTTMDALFEKAAKKYNVDVNLLKAIGKAESNFNASTVSSAGAIGVMQLMPGTASSLGVTNPYDAEQNIMGGAKYISRLLNQYNGNVKLALAAYNAGPGNVAKYGGIPPFKETQTYVDRVLNYAGKSLSADQPGSSAGISDNSTTLAATTGDTIEIKTETLLTLLTLMRTQMDLQMNSFFNTEYRDSLFSL